MSDLQSAVLTLQAALSEIHHAADLKQKADLSRTLRLQTMLAVRSTCDEAEAVVPAALWTLATYKELLFLDCHQK